MSLYVLMFLVCIVWPVAFIVTLIVIGGGW